MRQITTKRLELATAWLAGVALTLGCGVTVYAAWRAVWLVMEGR